MQTTSERKALVADWSERRATCLRALILDVSHGMHLRILSFLHYPDVLRLNCVNQSIHNWMQEEKASSERFRKLLEWHEEIERLRKIASVRLPSCVFERYRARYRARYRVLGAQPLTLKSQVSAL